MFRLAFLNIFRHRGRTATAVSAISFGIIALLLAGGFMEWIFWAMRESVIQSQLGHIQIARSGYMKAGAADPYEYLLTAQFDEKLILDSAPEVEVMTPRLHFNGLISHDDVTLAFVGEGVHPEKEVKLGKVFAITQGEQLSSSDEGGIIIGRGMAETLGLQLGDTVVLLVNTASGGISAVEGIIRGIFSTGVKGYDDSVLRLPIETARKLLRVSGTHVWAVMLDQTEHTDRVLQRWVDRFPEIDSQLQFIPWYEQTDFYNKTVALFSKQMDVVRFIIALIIVLSISNTLIMSVMERTGEIGTQMAIGIKRRKILQLFVTEGLLLGIVGGIAGLVLGVALAYIISAIGIPMPPPPGMDEGFTGEIILTFPLAVKTVALAVFATLLASFYPAWKASRLEIVNALRHNR